MFWDGPITDYEIASIKSYVDRGFNVWFWSFGSYNFPFEVTYMDASKLLSRDFIANKIHNHWNDSWGRATESTAATLYSDVLRYKLLARYGGWWFDFDSFCLRDVRDFDELVLDKKICLGWQDDEKTYVNNAILSIPNKDIAVDIVNIVDAIFNSKNIFSWGELGPDMLSSYIFKNNLEECVLDRDIFYPNLQSPNNENIWKIESMLTEDENISIYSDLDRSYTMHWCNNNLVLEDKVLGLPDKESLIGKVLSNDYFPSKKV